MEKKRKMSNSRFENQGWVEMTPKDLANLYSVSYTYTTPKRVVIDNLLNGLHGTQLDYIDEAVEKSDLREAKELIKHIMEKK